MSGDELPEWAAKKYWVKHSAPDLGVGYVRDEALGGGLMRVRFRRREATVRSRDVTDATDDEIRRAAKQVPPPLPSAVTRKDRMPRR